VKHDLLIRLRLRFHEDGRYEVGARGPVELGQEPY